MSEEITSAVILDLGSGYIKAGLAQTDFPSVCSPNISAKLTFPGEDALSKKKRLFGKNAIDVPQNTHTQIRPIERGFIRDWDETENILLDLYRTKLKTDPSNHPLLMSVYPDEQKHLKERLAQLFFESLNVPGFYCSIHSLFSLYGSGKTTGLVVDSGFGATTVVPIIDGYCHNYAHLMVRQGGSDLNKHLSSLLAQRDISLSNTDLEELKRTRVYLSSNYEEDVRAYQSGDKTGPFFELPDGKKIQLGSELIETSEALYNPTILGSKEPGIDKLILECLQKFSIKKRKALVNSIILSGGNTKVKGYVERLSEEIGFQIPSTLRAKIQASNDRQFLTWTGGAVVSALRTFQTMWITQADYDENGPSIVHRKCL